MKEAMVFPTRESERAISGYSVTLTENMKAKGIDIDNVTYIAGSPKTLLKQIPKLKKYDVVHIQHEYNLLGNYGLPFFVLYFMLAFGNCKIVTTMHTILSQKEQFKGSKIKTFLRKMLYLTQNKWINWFSDSIVVHANFFKEILAREYGVRKSKVTIFPQGIIENVPRYDKKKAKKEMKLSGPVYILMGSMVPDHGHDIVIRQAKEIGKTILVVANPGSVNDRNSDRTRKYLEECKKIAEQNKLGNYVRFDISDITDKKPEWWKYFSAADLVLLPYTGGIGSGIFAHSMAARRPVIASDILFFHEISKNFGSVATAKKREDFPTVIKNSMKPANYKKMMAECERYVSEYGLSVLATKYKKLYESL